MPAHCRPKLRGNVKADKQADTRAPSRGEVDGGHDYSTHAFRSVQTTGTANSSEHKLYDQYGELGVLKKNASSFQEHWFDHLQNTEEVAL